MLHNFLGQTELGNAIHQHAASSMQCFVHGYIIAHFGQITCTGQAAGATAHNSNLFALAFCRSFYFVVQAIFTSIISYKAFQTTNCHRLALNAQNALALALILLGTYATANSGQSAFALQNLVSLSKILLSNLMDEFGNFNINRAATHATRLGTVQATLCLIHCHFFSIAQSYLFKVFIANIGRLFRHRVSHSSTHLQ